MAKVNLKGKYIPLKYFASYSITVSPDRAHTTDEDGEERPAKTFAFRVSLDKKNNLYILPIKQEKNAEGKIVDVPAYSVADIVEAASGDKEKKAKIDTYNASLQKEFANYDMMSLAWQNLLLNGQGSNGCKSIFLDDYNLYNRQRAKDAGVTAGTILPSDIPSKVTTYETLSPSQVEGLASIAKFPKYTSAKPTTPTQDGGQGK